MPTGFPGGYRKLVDHSEERFRVCAAFPGDRYGHGDIPGFGFVGYQCGPPFMKGPFERSDEELEQELGELGELLDDRTVLVTHYPAAGYLDSGFGLPAIRDLVRTRPYFIHIHGHSHRNFGKDGRHFNVASAGQKRAMVIDLKAQTCEFLDERGSHGGSPW